MTQKEKAEAYDEALEKAKDYYKQLLDEDNPEWASEIKKIFPELKESEDSIMKQAFIRLVKAYHDVNFPTPEGFTRNDMLAWLEKQGESSSETHYWAEEEIEPIISDYLRGAEHYGGMIGRLRCLKPKSLEKQGEQKPADKIEPKFEIKEGKFYVCIRDLLDNYANKAFFKGDIYLSTQNGSLIPSNSNVPFKVVCPDTYFKDWTIQDAKPGDVLASKNGDTILIFRNLDNTTSFSSYYNIARKGELGWSNSSFIPATKEQRKQLEKAMADAGYTFDFEKKELKKIEQNSAWSKEDNEMINAIRTFIACGNTGNISTSKGKMIIWLKSLKDKYTWKPTKEQIIALRWVSNNVPYNRHKEEISGLLDQIKDL
jgi:hypothetical protein